MQHGTLGERLRALREMSGVSDPSELGRLAGLKSKSHLSMIERGVRGGSLTAHVAVMLARTLGCSVEWLVEGAGEAPDAFTVKAAVARAKSRRSEPHGNPPRVSPSGTFEQVSTDTLPTAAAIYHAPSAAKGAA